MYRGPLASCNYDCGYCPFAKRKDTAAQLNRDRESLQRFSSWIREHNEHQWKILFTPWGEGLSRSWYRQAIVEMSKWDHVNTVAIQTNLSCQLEWLSACDRQSVAFWTTFHPTEVPAEVFVRKVKRLREWEIRLSVGMVAVPDHLSAIRQMRWALPEEIYLWINAQQPRSRRYTDVEIAELTEIDPQFPFLLRRTMSLGKPCQTGETTFTVDGAGNMRRCHFVDQVIGQLYSPEWFDALRPRYCPNRFCDCFLGKSQLQSDVQQPFSGDRMFERIPDERGSF